MDKYILILTSFFSFIPLIAAESLNECGPKNVGAFLEKKLQRQWNEGSVRAWEEKGEFWSLPLGKDVKQLTAALQPTPELNCDIMLANVASFSARVLPKNLPQPSLDDLIKKAKSSPLRGDANIVSSVGTTLGVFQPAKGELILIMYPTKIASVIARGKGSAQRQDLKEILAKFPAELDIEYNFGGFAVRTFGGTGKLSMREAADTVFSDLRRNGYKPGPGSDKRIAEFDAFFPPERHESFWLKDNSIARVELQKLKNGQVRLNLNDDTERSN